MDSVKKRFEPRRFSMNNRLVAVVVSTEMLIAPVGPVVPLSGPLRKFNDPGGLTNIGPKLLAPLRLPVIENR